MRYYIAIMPWILVPFLFGEDEYERANRSSGIRKRVRN